MVSIGWVFVALLAGAVIGVIACNWANSKPVKPIVDSDHLATADEDEEANGSAAVGPHRGE